MHKWKNTVLTITAVVILAVSLVAARPYDARAVQGPDEILVANGADRPVPTAAQGTTTVAGTVNVGNLPATQQVAGNVAVSNLPAVQQVAGSVEVANFPAVQEVTGSLQMTRPELRRGSTSLSYVDQRQFEFPAGAVITDIVLDRDPVSNHPVCDVWLFEEESNISRVLHIFHPSAAERQVELHLESGFGPGGDTARGLFLNADCHIRVFWTGYAES